jgi:uncharacterized protein (TIGR03790 family)
MKTGRVLFATAALLLGLAAASRAQTSNNVLLVINKSSPDSIQIGEYYARARGVDQAQILRIEVDAKDELPRADYERRIEQPIGAWLGRNGAYDRILFIVLTKGIPLRIGGSSGRQGTVASVDSELALLYRKLTGRPVSTQGLLPNPYFLGDAPIGQAKPFAHDAQDIYLVTRLDGYTTQDVIALIDRAQKPARDGRFVLDMKAAWTSDVGNDWLKRAADRLTAMGKGDSVTLETSGTMVKGVKDVLGYYSWGSNDSAIRVRHFDIGFLPGALAGMYVSTDGRTFTEPPAEWTIGSWDNRASYYAGAPQSLAGDLIRDGVTGVAAHVTEPYLDATIRPDILFPAYLSGFTLAEAYYLAMPYLSWQTVVIGDPLCLVASRRALETTTLNPDADPATELPRFFSTRRFEMAQDASKSVSPDAIKLGMKAEARGAKGDAAGAREALLQATKVDARLFVAQLLLAADFEREKDYAKAAERYRAALTTDPNNIIALNNLAYLLAVRENKPNDALPFARRAYALAPRNGSVVDTLAWTLYLSGDGIQALRYMQESIAADPTNGDALLHAAEILASAGKLNEARQFLERAVNGSPELADREDVKKLQARLASGRI